MSRRIRVLVWYRCPPGAADQIEAAFFDIARELAGTPGLVGSELLSARGDQGSLVVMSEWASMATFRAWEEGSTHRQTTSPIRPYRDPHRRPAFEIYEVSAAVGQP